MQYDDDFDEEDHYNNTNQKAKYKVEIKEKKRQPKSANRPKEEDKK